MVAEVIRATVRVDKETHMVRLFLKKGIHCSQDAVKLFLVPTEAGVY